MQKVIIIDITAQWLTTRFLFSSYYKSFETRFLENIESLSLTKV